MRLHRLTALVLALCVPVLRAEPVKKKPLTLEIVSGLTPIVPTGVTEASWRGARRLTYLKSDGTGPNAGAALYEFDVDSKEATFLLEPPMTGGSQRKTISLSGSQWNPSGTILLLNSLNDLWLHDTRTQKLRQLTSDDAEEEDPSFSPDSSYAAFTKNGDLYVVEIASGKETRLTTSGEEHVLNGKLGWVYEEELARRRGSRAYEWSPDSKAIAYLRLDERQVPDQPIVDHAPAHGRLLSQKYPKAGDRNPVPSVHVVEVDGSGGQDIGFSPEDVLLGPEVSWSPDSRFVAYCKLDRTQTSLGLWFLPRKTGEPKLVLEEKDPAWINAIAPPSFLPDGGFLWLSERSGFAHLYRYNRHGKLLNAVTKGNWMIDEEFTVDGKNGLVYLVGTEKNPRERHVYRVKLDGSRFQRLSQERGCHSLMLSPDGRFYFDTFSSSDSPAKSAVYTTDGKLLAAVHDPPNRLAEYDLGAVEHGTLPGPDGTLFYTRLVRPTDFDAAKKYPVIVHVYGGPRAQLVLERWGNSTLFERLLASRGFLVWTLDNRGSGGRGHAFETPILKKLGEIELKDQLEGVAYLKKQSWIDPDRFAITGWSYGGYLALMAAVKAPAAFKVAVAGAPVVDWHLYDSIYTEKYMKLPSENTEGYQKAAPVNFASKLGPKLLMLHGMADDNVHFQQSVRFVDALVTARKDFVLVPLPGQKHSTRAPSVRTYVNQRILEFFEKNL
jgi:dipeptidyl-peptidase-4